MVLADLLSQRGLLSIPETIKQSVKGTGHTLPDVTIADLWGVRVLLEGRIADKGGVQESLLRDAKKRVEQGVCPICLAVLYPPKLRSIQSLSSLTEQLNKTELLIRAVSQNDDGQWIHANLDGLTEQLRRTYELLVSEDVLIVAAAGLERAIDSASRTIAASKAVPKRLQEILGIPEELEDDTDDMGDE